MGLAFDVSVENSTSIFIFLLTVEKEEGSAYWEADSLSRSQEISAVYRDWRFITMFTRIPRWILSCGSWTQSLCLFFNIHFKIILPVVLIPSVCIYFSSEILFVKAIAKIFSPPPPELFTFELFFLGSWYVAYVFKLRINYFLTKIPVFSPHKYYVTLLICPF